MPVNLLVIAGISGIGGAVIEKVLNEIGKEDIADIVGKTSKSILIGVAVGSVVNVLLEVNKLLLL